MKAVTLYLDRCQIDTPATVVSAVWKEILQRRKSVAKVVDFGAGDGRFAHGGKFSEYVGYEIDARRSTLALLPPGATLLTRCAFSDTVSDADLAAYFDKHKVQYMVPERRTVDYAILDIAQLLQRKPKALSGGQRQRVAMGRAIVRNPKVFLFDEPLSNLDAKLRVQMRTEIKKVHQKVRTTTVYVTHDQVEAMTLADRVVVMNKGRIEQIGTPNDLYHNPATRFVAGFIGSPAMNFLPCRLEDVGGKLNIRLTDRIAFPLPSARAARYQGVSRTDKLLLGIRPEHLAEASVHPESGVEAFDAVLDVTEPMGMETLVYFTMDGTQVCGRVNPNAGARDGAPLRLAVDLNNMHLLNEVTGVVI